MTIPAPGDPFKLPASLPPGLPRQEQPLNGYEMGLARADMLSLLKGSDTGTF